MSRLLPCCLILVSGCFFTNLHSPRANKSGEVTGGVHVAGVLDTSDDGDDGPDGVGTIAGTIRVGTDIGEIGGTLSAFAAEASLKVPVTPQDGKFHLSLLGTVGSYLIIFPELTVGALAGYDFGPVTPYIGFRQHLFVAEIYVGHFIGGLEIRVADSVSIMAEANYNTLFSGEFNDDDATLSVESIFDSFDLPVFSLGLVFGQTRAAPQAPLPPPSFGPPGAN